MPDDPGWWIGLAAAGMLRYEAMMLSKAHLAGDDSNAEMAVSPWITHCEAQRCGLTGQLDVMRWYAAIADHPCEQKADHPTNVVNRIPRP